MSSLLQFMFELVLYGLIYQNRSRERELTLSTKLQQIERR